MDTFNFSFFDDKPQNPEADKEENSSSAPSESEVKADTPAKIDDDPFGFNAFDTNSDPDSRDNSDLDLTASASDASISTSESEEDFDLSSLPNSFSLDESPANAEFPDLSLDSLTPAPTDVAADNFDGLQLETDSQQKDDAISFEGLDLAPEVFASSSGNTDLTSATGEDFPDLALSPEDFGGQTEEADDFLALAPPESFGTSEPPASPDLATEPFDLQETEATADLDPSAAAAPDLAPDTVSAPDTDELFDLSSLSDSNTATSVTSDMELDAAIPPVEPAEIRASVEPATFLEPSAPWPNPVQEGKKNSSGEGSSSSAEKAKSKPAKFLTTDDPYGEVAPPRERLRVAILGASGIGKNHARWFTKHSCDIVSFLGSSDESVEYTNSQLQSRIGFTGKGFTDLGQLLSETQPQAVCIASPTHVHYTQAIQCLEAGIHVLCEKPLVYAPTRTKRENMDGARELLKAAAKRDLVLATQLQYGTATPILCRLAGVSPFDVGDFAMEIETTNPKSPRDPRQLWIDLAPHPLSVAQYLGGDSAEIIPETLQILPSRSAYITEVTARFGVRCEGGRLLMCRVIVRWFDKIVDNREPRRRFSFNGRVVQYSGVKSPDGTYIAQYVAPDGYISHYSDPVDYLIGNFVRTCWDEDELVLSSEQGVQNLDWLLSTAEKI